MSTDNFGGTIDVGNTKTSIVLPKTASTTNDAYKNFFIKIVHGTTINIRTITTYIGTTFTITLDQPLTFDPTNSTDTFYISSTPNSLTTPESGVIVNGTQTTIKLNSSSSSTVADAYKNQWIYFTASKHVRFISGYDPTTFTLTIESLPEKPADGAAFSIYSEFMGEYVIFNSIDLFFLSGFIDSIGGINTFGIIISVSSCLLIISSILVLTMGLKKPPGGSGLDIPGIGHLSPRQPLVIQMPMQTQPYPLFSSPFPRND